MKSNKSILKVLIGSFLVVFLLSSRAIPDFSPKHTQPDFWSMNGTVVTHYFNDQSDSLSGPEIFELQGEDGVPIWFGRYIFKDVCISGKCKMIRLWLFWDGVGNYLGMQIPENEPLTKSDHTEFAPEDYDNLDDILRDTASILKSLKQEDLVVIPDSIDPYEAYKVDGYTAATQPALADVVVEDAVYTCYTLWHTVYGPVQTKIYELLQNRLSKKFLTHLFQSNNSEYISWSINIVENQPEYHADFYPKIAEFISSENPELANQALGYFRSELIVDTSIQRQLVQIIPDVDRNLTYEILWKFINAGDIHEKTVLNILKLFVGQKISVGAYNLILRLITTEHLNNNEQIVGILNDLSEDENRYVRNLTMRKLNKEEN